MTALRPEIPKALVQVVRKLLQKDPAKRYGNAQVLLNDLRVLSKDLEAGTPTRSARHPTAADLQADLDLVRRTQPSLVNASLLVVAILGAIALAAYLILPAEDATEFSIYLGGLGVLVVIYLFAFSRSRAYQYQRPRPSDLPKLKELYLLRDRLREEMTKAGHEA